jgi:hypothetical protein
VHAVLSLIRSLSESVFCVPWRSLSLGGGLLKADRQGAKKTRNLEDHNWIIFAKTEDAAN